MKTFLGQAAGITAPGRCILCQMVDRPLENERFTLSDEDGSSVPATIFNIHPSAYLIDGMVEIEGAVCSRCRPLFTPFLLIIRKAVLLPQEN